MKKHLNIFMLVISLALFSLPAIAMEPSDTPEQQLKDTVKQAADKQGSQGFWAKLDKNPRTFETMRRVVQQYLNPQGNNPLVSTFAKKLIEIIKYQTLSRDTSFYPNSVVFSPNGARLASGFRSGEIKIWDLVRPNNEPQTLLFRTDLPRWLNPINSVAFSPDGKKLAAGVDLSNIKIWDLDNPSNQPQTLSSYMIYIFSGAFNILDLVNPNNQPQNLSGSSGYVYSVTFSPDGTRLAAGSMNGKIKIWDLVNPNKQPQTLSAHTGTVRSVAFSPDGKKLASGSDDTIKIWDLVNPNNQPQTLFGHTDGVTSVAFSPNGKKLASGSFDKTINIWDLVNLNNQPQTLFGHTDGVTSVAFSPNGTKLASGSVDRTIKIWDLVKPNNKPETLSGHTDVVTSLAFSPDGSRLASGDSRNKIKIWNIPGIAQLPEFIKSLYADEKGLKKFLLLRAILESNATTDGNGEAKQSKPLDLYNSAAIAVLKDLPIWLQKALQDKNMVRVFKKKG